MAKIENVKNVNRMLMSKPLGRRSHGRPRRLWKKSVKLFLRGYGNWMHMGLASWRDG